MPELPEVETVARTLRPKLVGRRFGRVTVHRASAVGFPHPATFASGLEGQTVTGIDRRGKYLLILLASGARLIAHLRMTGQLAVRPTHRPGRHARMVAALDDGSFLHFVDQRTFGRLYLLPDADPGPIAGLAALGPEPGDPLCTPAYLAARCGATRRPIKNVLLDQTVVAGLGNIYADEALAVAGIHPATPADRIGRAAMRRLHAAMVAVLNQGIANGGTTFAHFRNADGERGGNQIHLAVYGRAGEPCRSCGNRLQRQVLAGRTSTFCMTCQPRLS